MKIIIPIIVGAIIGYFTNWLAIKMLFRPHREIRILGFRLPFTPGLIPKERYRMSKSIGNAVGEHLLTPETIQGVLSSDEAKSNIRNWINNKFLGLQKIDKSILELLNQIEVRDYDQILYKIEDKIVNSIITNLKNKKMRDEILKYVEENIYEKSKDNILRKIKNEGEIFLKELLNSADIMLLIDKTITNNIKEWKKDNRSLNKVLSNDVVEIIEGSIEDNKENIVVGIRKILHEPDVKKKLEDSIDNIILQNTSRVITTFISVDIISEKVIQAIYNYIDSEDLEETSLFFINNLLEKLLETPVSKFSIEIEKFILKDENNTLSTLLINSFSKEENIEGIISFLYNSMKIKDDKIKNMFLKLIDEKFDDNINSLEFREGIYKILDRINDKLLNRPIYQILGNIKSKQIDKFTIMVGELVYKFGEGSLLEIINIFNISKIVEDQINSFEVEYTEELIIDIAERELNAITRLGALLGGVMGLLSPLLQLMA
ncbi:MAG TPA: DUF445 family protein [Tissierellaceae bacterium]|nr:DUF445 family protein [Tissierellaceae bacterium]